MIRTQVYLTKELHNEISLLTRSEKKTGAILIRDLLSLGLKTKKQRKKTSKNPLLAIAGLGGKGSKYISRDIDKILYGE